MADAGSQHSCCSLKLSVELSSDKVLSSGEVYSWYVGRHRVLCVEAGTGVKPVPELVALEELAQPELMAVLDTMLYLDLGLVADQFAVEYNRFVLQARRLVELSQEAGLVSSFGFTNDHLVIELSYPAFSDFGVKLIIASVR